MMKGYPGDRANGPGAWPTLDERTDMDEAICAVEGCTKVGRLVRGWCKMHYTRWARTGAPGEAAPRKRADCSVEDCEGKHYGLGLCAKHYCRQVQHGTLGLQSRAGERNPSWVGDALTYSGLHQRLRRVRGPAAAHDCRHCDQPAKHWAYDGQDTEERTTPDGMAYSVRVEHYLPLCVSCHRVFDDSPVGQQGAPRRKSGEARNWVMVCE